MKELSITSLHWTVWNFAAFCATLFSAAAQWWWTTPGITSLPSRERDQEQTIFELSKEANQFKFLNQLKLLSFEWNHALLVDGFGEPRELHHYSPRPRTNNSLDFNRDFRYWCNSFLRSHHCIEHDHFLRSIDFNIANIHRTVGAHSNAKNTIESTFLWQWWDIGWYVLGFHPFRAGDFPHLWEICLYIQCTTLHQSASTALHHRHH